MNKEFSVFKSTIFLYIVVLILPFGFYFVYDSFHTIQKDTKTISKITNISTSLNDIVLNQNKQSSVIKSIDRNLYNIALWVEENNNASFYIGSSSLKQDFENIQSNWDRCKQKYLAHDERGLKQSVLKTNALLKNFSIIVEKMVYLKQDKIINVFYISLMIVMILMLLSIYLVRAYIEYQISKHSIYDKETHLYNHDYLMEHLKTTCARATRYKYPLSMLSISMKNIDKKTLPEAEYKKLMEMVGDMLLSLTRTSDVACRYNENHIAIILPFTEHENAEILKGRIEETFQKQDFGISTHPEFKLSIVQYEPKEAPKDYISRATKVLETI